MIHSIVGQSERWAQLTALQPPPAAQSGPGSGPGFSNVGTTAADPTVVNPVAGSTASPLSSNMSFMLMMFGGGLDSTTGSGAGAGSTSGSGSTTASPDETSNIQGGTGAASILANLQSLIASLTGGTSGTPATAPTGSSLLQDLDSIITDLGTTTTTPGGAQPPPPPPSSGAATGQPSDGNDITNQSSAAAVATWGDGPAGPGGGWQEQFALAAYQSGSTSGPNSQSAWQSLSV